MGDQTTNFAKKYSQNIELLATTTVGEFDGKVAEDYFDGAEELFWEQLGGAAENEVTEAFGQQEYRQLDHLRRKVFTADYELPLMLEKNHEMRTAVDFRSSYVSRTVEAFKRSKSIEVFKSMYNPAFTGKNGTTSVAFDYTNQTVPVTLGASSGNAGMTKEKIIKGREKLKIAGWNVRDPSLQPYVTMSAIQLSDLLDTEEFTSRDYAAVEALESGEKSKWLGCEFIFSETTPYYDVSNTVVDLTWEENSKGVRAPVDTDTADIRACSMYIKENIGCYTSKNFNTEAGKIERYRYNWGMYACWSHGGVRRQEDGHILIPCDQSIA